MSALAPEILASMVNDLLDMTTTEEVLSAMVANLLSKEQYARENWPDQPNLFESHMTRREILSRALNEISDFGKQIAEKNEELHKQAMEETKQKLDENDRHFRELAIAAVTPIGTHISVDLDDQQTVRGLIGVSAAFQVPDQPSYDAVVNLCYAHKGYFLKDKALNPGFIYYFFTVSDPANLPTKLQEIRDLMFLCNIQYKAGQVPWSPPILIDDQTDDDPDDELSEENKGDAETAVATKPEGEMTMEEYMKAHGMS